MSIDWSLLGPPVDVGAHFQAGLERGRAVRKRSEQESALAAYGSNPNDPAAQSALFAIDPDMAYKLTQQRTAQTELALKSRQAEAAARAGALYAGGDSRGAINTALAGGDPDTAKQFMALDKASQDMVAQKYKAAGPVLYRAQQMPYEQRKAFIASAAPSLLGQGWTAQEIEGFDPSDQALQGLVTSVMTVEQLTDRQKIDYQVIPEGGELRGFDYLGRPMGGGEQAAPVTLSGAPQAAVGSALTAAGLPAPVVAGFLGNFDVEGGYGGAKGDGGSAAGIAQWRGERQTNFERVIGKPVSQAAPEEQARFVLWEMQNPEAAGMTVLQRDAIMAATTPGEAAELIDKFYERSSGKHRSRRMAAAERAAGGANPDTVRQQAQAAIAKGADPAAVRARAAEMGVSI